jgi:hypothetical protein
MKQLRLCSYETSGEISKYLFETSELEIDEVEELEE